MRSSILAAAILLALPLAGSVNTTAALAQGDDRAMAIALFEQGRALFKNADYGAALTKFEAAAKLMRTFGILINVAECQEKLGRTASAWATWREARAVAIDAHKAEDEANAAGRLRLLEPKLSHLTVIVPPAVDQPELEVRRDDVNLPRGAWGSPIAADPGTHVVEARAPGKKARRMNVDLKPNGGAVTVTVTPLEAEPEVGAAVAAPVSPGPSGARAEPSSGTGSGRTLGWALGGAGLLGAGVGGVLAIIGTGKQNRAIDAATTAVKARNSGDYAAAGKDLDSANRQVTTGLVVAGIGGAVLLTGVLLVVTAPNAEAKTGWSVGPWLATSSGGATITGQW